MYQWNEEHQCIVDAMGLPISRTQAKILLAQCEQHLARAPVELFEIHHREMLVLHPRMVHNMNLTIEDMA